MKSKIAIYFAGSIKKAHESSDDSFWTPEDLSVLKENLNGCEIVFLNPALRTDDLSDPRSAFGRDMIQVFSSNVVFVDARDRRGLGVGAEMMWAKINRIPVIVWAPRNSHYRKDQTTVLDVPVQNFIHPFVESLSDKIVENLEEGAKWIREFIVDHSIEIKGIEAVSGAMQYYKESQMQHDEPMKELLLSNEELEKRMHRMHPQVLIEEVSL
ncbi:MAG TPA: hypothetical protein VLG49_07685 [Rhabdochlamydiaceae bacterium]|nr:hypothetical protein [Rhabdochlamydiaceae bacterium]